MRAARTAIVLPVLCLFGLFVWSIPFIRFGPFAYGYDTGLYRRYLLQPFVSFPNTPVPGLDHTVFLPRLLLDAFRFIPDTDVVLFGVYLLLGMAGVVSVWCFARAYLGERGAAIAAILYVLSAVQFVAQGAFFFKQAVALPLFLFGLLAYEKKKYGLAALLGVLIILSHQTSSVLYLVLAGAGLFVRMLWTRSIPLAYVFSVTAVAAAYLLLHPHVAQKVASPPVSVFIYQSDYLLWSLPLLVLAVLGIRRSTPVFRHNHVLLGAVAVLVAFVVLRLPFYNRVYVYLDLMLVIPAACGVLVAFEWLRTKSSRAAYPLTAALFVIAALPMLWLQKNDTSSLSPEVRETVHSLTTLPAGTAIITSPGLLPWAQGWSLARVHAPGIFKEPHTQDEWRQYWSHSEPEFDRAFLASFPQPAYIFARPLEGGYVAQCAHEIRPFLYDVATCL